jgi:hypothetical protein
MKQDIASLVASPITAASESTITALEKRYSKMTPQGKALVTNYSDLQNARAQLNAIKAGTAAPATDQAAAAATTDQAASTDQAAN